MIFVDTEGKILFINSAYAMYLKTKAEEVLGRDIQEIIPIHEAYRYRWYNMDRVVDYNAALREMCEETGCTFVSAVKYAFEEFLSDDTGAHYDRRYHIYWAQEMANQMGLWEDAE